MTSPISSALIPPEASVSEQSRNDFQARLAGLGNGGRNMSPEAKAKKLREACEGFESIFIQKMWQEMRNTVPKSGLLHGREEKFWQDMYDQELSKSMTRAGGIGLADMMYEQLSRGLASASRDAAGMTTSAAFAPEAAPLLAPAQTVYDGHFEESAPAASVYDGSAPGVGDVQEDAVLAEQQAMPGQTQQAQATMAQLAQPVQPIQPVAQAVERPRAAHHVKKGDINNSNALDLSYIARREAGDKLGARAVRPALRHRNPESGRAAQPVEAAANAAPPQPGSPAALAAALELARSGAPNAQAAPMSLDEIVARVKAGNAAGAAQTVAQAPAAPAAMAAAMDTTQAVDENAPVTRKVRFTTNVPRRDKSKKNSQAIRMLNVDNVSANSKAGQGLAAYHASQAAFAAQEAPAGAVPAPGAMATGAPAAAQPIAPLRASEAGTGQSEASFSIPPLTGSGLKS